MAFGRLFDAFLPRQRTRMLIVSVVFTIAVHLAFDLSFERTISLFIGFFTGFFGISGGADIYLVISSVMFAFATNQPFLLALFVAAIGFFFLDSITTEGGFLGDLGFAVKLVIVTVLAYVSALTIGPEVVDFVASGGLNG